MVSYKALNTMFVSFFLLHFVSVTKLEIAAILAYSLLSERWTFWQGYNIGNVTHHLADFLAVNIAQHYLLRLAQQRIFKYAGHTSYTVLLEHIHVVFQLPLMRMVNLVGFLYLVYDLPFRVIIVNLSSFGFRL